MSNYKTVNFTNSGFRADIGDIAIQRLLPNGYTYHVGHFVFLDYIAPFALNKPRPLNPAFAHPHRGIATLTYILNGEADHYDSRGHRGTVHSGGVQWMKAGNGIIHNEAINADSKTTGRLVHGFQFWINLPAAHKREDPAYMALQAADLPLIPLDKDAGKLKVVLGQYGEQRSAIPVYADQFLYHIQLNPGKSFSIPTEEGLEYAVFLPQHNVVVNGKPYHLGDLIVFDHEGGLIEFTNNQESVADIIFFGGEKYTEPFVAKGPFVMNTREEIHQANMDYQNGKYGEINYQ